MHANPLHVEGFEYHGEFLLGRPPLKYRGVGFSMGADWGCRANVAGWGAVELVIHKNRYTDLASIPWWIRWKLDRIGPNKEASPLHDEGYKTGSVRVDGALVAGTQELMDSLYLAGMLESGENPRAALIIWRGLDLGGGRQWRAYRKLAREIRRRSPV